MEIKQITHKPDLREKRSTCQLLRTIAQSDAHRPPNFILVLKALICRQIPENILHNSTSIQQIWELTYLKVTRGITACLKTYSKILLLHLLVWKIQNSFQNYFEIRSYHLNSKTQMLHWSTHGTSFQWNI